MDWSRVGEALMRALANYQSWPVAAQIGVPTAMMAIALRRPLGRLTRRSIDFTTEYARRKDQEAWFVAYTWLAAAVFGMVALATLWELLRVFADYLAGEGNLIKTLSKDAEGLRAVWFLLLGLVGALAIPLALNRARIQQRQTRVQEKGHVTDRIIRAGELLSRTRDVQRHVGDDPGTGRPIFEERTEPAIEARLSAIYTLERVAQESVGPGGDGAEHWPIMMTMLAYIRHRRGEDERDWQKTSDILGTWELDYRNRFPPPKEASSLGKYFSWFKSMEARRAEWILSRGKEDEQFEFKLKNLPRPREDVAAAISVLRNRIDSQIVYEHSLVSPAQISAWSWEEFHECNEIVGISADLDSRVAYFKARLDFVERQFENWIRYHSDRPNGRFELGSVPLHCADLRGVNWRHHELEDAWLISSDLRGANFCGADLSGARLEGANLEFARLESANLDGAFLQAAKLDDAFLLCATLSGSYLTGADLTQADLTGAKLTRACLRGANLCSTILDGSNLKEAGLSGASMIGCSLIQVEGLTQDQVDSAYGDAQTASQLPMLGLVPPDHWCKETISPIIWSTHGWRNWREYISTS